MSANHFPCDNADAEISISDYQNGEPVRWCAEVVVREHFDSYQEAAAFVAQLDKALGSLPAAGAP